MPSFSWLVQYHAGKALFRELSHSNVGGCGSLNGRAGVFHIKVDDYSLSQSLTLWDVYLFHTTVVCYHDPIL